jgi:hypothetical protein
MFGRPALLICALGAATANAQSTVPVRGVVYDSLRGRPIPHALVAVLGARLMDTTDEQGRFHFAGVAAGPQTFVIQHASLDSSGFRGLSRRHQVDASQGEIRITVPSFQTLWRAACGGEPPSDSGIVYGTIRRVSDQAPVGGAAIEVGWIVTSYDKARGIRQRRVFGETTTNANGQYAVCGVPSSFWVRVLAATPTASGAADIPPSDLRIARRDLLIGPTADQDSTSRGTILGVLVDQDGAPFSEARVVLDDSTEVRSNGEGHFAFRNVQPGTRQIEVLSIGMVPVIRTVDLLPLDSVTVRLSLRRVTTLDAVRVIATRRGQMIAEGIEDRRKRAIGYQMDQAELQAYTSFSTVLNDFPGVRVRQAHGDYHVFISDGRGGECIPEIWIDNARMSLAALHLVRPRDVMAVEYFPRAGMIPLEFRRTQEMMHCGAVIVWTHWAFSR